MGKTKLIQRLRSLETFVVLASVLSLLLVGPLREALGPFPGLLFLATLVLFMVPGLLLSHWFLRDHFPGVASLPAAFVVSAGIFGLSGVPMLVLHLSLDFYLRVAAGILGLFLLVALLRVFVRRRPPGSERGVEEPSSFEWLWVPFLLLSGALAVASRVKVPHSYNDMWVYLSYVREFLDTSTLALYEPYFGNETGTSRVQINGWLLEQASFSRVSGIDPIDLVLRYLAPTLVVLALLAFYALARMLLKNRTAALLAGCLYALFFLSHLSPSIYTFGGEFITRVAEDKFFARFLFLPVALGVAFGFLESRKKRYLALFAFLCWAVLAVHPAGLAIIGLSVTGFGLAHLAVNWREWKVWTKVVSLGAALLSVLLLPVLYVMTTGESLVTVLKSADINAHNPEILENVVFARPGWERILPLGENLYIMHPSLLLDPAIAVAFLLGMPFLFARLKASLAAQMLAGVLLLVTAVCYIPPLATFVGEHIVLPGQLWRLAWPIPLAAVLTIGWMAWEALSYARRALTGRGFSTTALAFSPLALVILLAALASPLAIPGGAKVYRTSYTAQSDSFPMDPAFEWMQDNIKRPSVVFAPDLENTVIPAYSSDANVVSLRGGLLFQILKPLDQRLDGRGVAVPEGAADVRKFYYGPTLKEGMRILRHHEADYLLVRANSPLDAQLDRLPGFTPLDVPSQRYSLYAVDRPKLGS